MRVAILPDWRHDNPYQRLLAKALAPLGVEAVFPKGYRRGLPLSRALLSAPRPDLLHLHWPSAYLRSENRFLRTLYCLRTLLDVAILRRFGIPIVWTVHNIISHDTSTPRVELWFSSRLAAMADQLVVHGEAAKQEVMKRLGAAGDKITVIPHGSFRSVYGSAPSNAESRSKLGLPQDVPIALFFGLIRPYKGVPDLLRAWKHLGSRRGQAILVIKGNAPEPAHAAEVKALAQGLAGVVLDLRHVSDDDVPLLMAAATVMVLPFRQSLTSGTVRLAQDYGVPIVAPKVAGTVDGEHLVLAESLDPDSFSEAILQGIASLRRSVPATDDWAAIAERHLEVMRAAKGLARA